MDIEKFRQCGKEAVDFICDYLNGINAKNVYPSIHPDVLKNHMPASPPADPVEWEETMEFFKNYFVRSMERPMHNRYFCEMPVGGSFPSLIADMFTDGFGNIPQTKNMISPYVVLEQIVMDWLCKAMQLPQSFRSIGNGKGLILSSVAKSTFDCLIAARNQVLKNYESNYEMFTDKLVAYCSVDTDYFVMKAMHSALIIINIIPTNDDQQIDVDKLKSKLEEDKASGLIPVFVCANFGSNKGGCDDLDALGEICELNHMWLHVDAKYAGFSLVCPEMRLKLTGIDRVDSLSMNADIWGLTHQYCSCLWISNKNSFFFAHETNLDKYENSTVKIRHEHPYRALNLWFAIQTYGINGIHKQIHSQIKMAKYFQSTLENDGRFAVVNRVEFNFVLFRLEQFNDAVNENLFSQLLRESKVCVSSDTVNNAFVIKLCVSSSNIKQTDIDAAYESIKSIADKIIGDCTCIE